MDRSKRLGAITMVVAVVMAFAFLTLSDGWFAQVDLIRTIMGVLIICLSREEGTYGGETCLTEIPTRYPLLLCLIAFGVGLLLYRGFIRLPPQQPPDREPTSDQP